MMRHKTARVLARLAGALFCAAFAFVVVSILCLNQHPPLWFYAACALGGGGLWLLFGFLTRHPRGAWRAYPWLLLGILLVLPVIQSVLGMRLEIDPFADFGAVLHGAREWVQDGTFCMAWDREFYFYIYPHNLGLTALLALLFRAVDALGGDCFYLAAVVLNSVLATCSILLCADILRRTLGYAAGVTGAVLFLLLPPFYVLGTVFYTDVMSFCFPLLALWLSLLARGRSLRRRWYLDVLLALTAFVGYHIKATVLIMVVAIWIGMGLRGQWRALLSQAAAVVCVFVAGTLLWNAWLFSTYLDADLARENALPMVNWLVLGVSADEDAELFGETAFEAVFYGGDTAAAREQAGWQAFRARFAQRQREGLLGYYARKMAVAMGSGTLGLSDFLDDNPWNDTALHDYVLYDGVHYPAYDAYCSGIMLALLLLALAGGVRLALRGQEKSTQCVEVWVALIGVFLFLLFWEPRDRYFSNYFCVLVIAAVSGLHALYSACRLPADAFNQIKRGVFNSLGGFRKKREGRFIFFNVP